jgi:uncharacterized membrane protein
MCSSAIIIMYMFIFNLMLQVAKQREAALSAQQSAATMVSDSNYTTLLSNMLSIACVYYLLMYEHETCYTCSLFGCMLMLLLVITNFKH